MRAHAHEHAYNSSNGKEYAYVDLEKMKIILKQTSSQKFMRVCVYMLCSIYIYYFALYTLQGKK